MSGRFNKALGCSVLLAANIAMPSAWAQDAQGNADPSSSATGSQAANDTPATQDLLNDLGISATPAEGPNKDAAASDAAPATATTDGAAGKANPAAEAEILPTIPVAQKPKTMPEQAEERRPHSRALEEIVVTATKREESIRDIPASISAFTGASLENEGKLNLNDFVQQTPGVTAAQGSAGFIRITMRGISTDTNPTSGNPSPVGIFIGDSAFTDPYIANIIPDLSAFDISGVQVLKGPQGTLFGGAALSGAIRYELQEPVLGEWQFREFSQYTKPSEGSVAWTHGGAINIPILKDGDMATRLVYVKREYPGVYDDYRTGQKDVDEGGGDQIRGILMWKPTEESKLKFTHLSQDFFAPNAINRADNPDGPRGTDQVILKLPSKNKFSLDSFEANYDFDSMRVVALSSWLKKDATFNNDYTPVLVGPTPNEYPAQIAVLSSVIDRSKAFSQEVRLQSNDDGPFKWLVGAYYYKYKMFFNILIDTPLTASLTGPDSVLGANPLLMGLFSALGLPSGSLQESTSLLNGTSRAKADEKSLFADFTYTLWDDLDLSVGARFYSTSVNGGFIGSGILILAENNGQNSNSVAEIKERGINPKFSATYRFSEDVSLYALANKGYRFGGIQSVPSTATNGVPPTFKSDTIWNYELGLRTSWLEQTLNADLTAFYIKYNNPIITQATQGVPISYNDNVSAAISRGLEASVVWNTPVDGLAVRASGGLTDAHITAPFKASNGTTVNPGQEMPGAARYQYSGSVQYLKPISFMLLGLNTNYTYVGKGYNNLTHDAEINGYGNLGAGLILSSPVLSFNPKVAINFSNLLNVTKPVAGGPGKPLVGGQPFAAYGLTPPRTLTVRFSMDLE